MNTQKKNKDFGTIGESFVLERLINKGFLIYKRNIRQWGLELDLVVYKYNPIRHFLELRVVEVKTRVSQRGDYLGILDNYGLEDKWRRVRGRLYGLKEEIIEQKGLDVGGCSAHYDLAIVFSQDSESENSLKMHTYIKDVNLFI